MLLQLYNILKRFLNRCLSKIYPTNKTDNTHIPYKPLVLLNSTRNKTELVQVYVDCQDNVSLI